MNPRSASWAPVTIAAAIGAGLWFVASWLTGKREPWDGPFYWVVAYPLAILGAAALGQRYPERPWRWALVLFESQFLAMAARNGELGNLWPIGMALFAVIAVPAIAAAQFAGRRFGARPPQVGRDHRPVGGP
jgi:hypothetical protein